MTPLRLRLSLHLQHFKQLEISLRYLLRFHPRSAVNRGVAIWPHESRYSGLYQTSHRAHITAGSQFVSVGMERVQNCDILRLEDVLQSCFGLQDTRERSGFQSLTPERKHDKTVTERMIQPEESRRRRHVVSSLSSFDRTANCWWELKKKKPSLAAFSHHIV